MSYNIIILRDFRWHNNTEHYPILFNSQETFTLLHYSFNDFFKKGKKVNVKFEIYVHLIYLIKLNKYPELVN